MQKVHRGRPLAAKRHRNGVHESGDGIDLRNGVRHLFAVALRQTPGHDEPRTPPESLGHETTSVGPEAGHGDEAVVTLDTPRIVRDSPDGGGQGAHDPLLGQRVQQRAHRHLAARLIDRHHR